MLYIGFIMQTSVSNQALKTGFFAGFSKLLLLIFIKGIVLA
jgi:hypothetical protein